jgi:hypothetical protein
VTGVGPTGLDTALRAARHGDLAALHATIDWELSEAPIPARSAGHGVPGLLVSGLDQGIAGIRRLAEDWREAVDLLERIAERFATASGVRPARPSELTQSLRLAQVAELPDAVSDAQRAFFDPLRARAARLREVLVVETLPEDLPVILTPGSDMLVLPLELDAYR